MHRILSSRTYIGEHIFNQRCAKTGELKPQEEWITSSVRQAIANPDPAFRKAYLRLFVDTITVGDSEIAISGLKAALAKAVSLSDLPPAGTMVPSFVREWRPVGDAAPPSKINHLRS